MAVLFPGTEELFKPRVAAVRGGLKDEGLVEGRDYVLEARVASGDFSQLPRLPQDLDALLPKVFVAAATAAGVVHRPGGTATGNVMNAVGGEESLTAKRLGTMMWSCTTMPSGLARSMIASAHRPNKMIDGLALPIA